MEKFDVFSGRPFIICLPAFDIKLLIFTCRHLLSRQGMQLLIPLDMTQSFLPDLKIKTKIKTHFPRGLVLTPMANVLALHQHNTKIKIVN